MPDQANWIYLLHPLRGAMLVEGPTEGEAESLAQHVQYLQNLARDGQVLLAGRTQTQGPETFGLVIFHAPNKPAASQIMHSDPAIRDGVMRGTLYPYKVAVGAGRG